MIHANGTQKVKVDIPTDDIVSTVYRSFDYDKFKIIGENRVLNEANVERLKESFNEQQLMSITIVNEKFEVIDGQHRLEAARTLGLPVYYTVCRGYGLPEVQLYNTTSKKWDSRDFLHSHVVSGKEAYLLVDEFLKAYPFLGMRNALAILSGYQHNSGKQKRINGKKMSIKSFEKGNFEVENIKFAEKAANQIMDFKDYFKCYNRVTFVKSILPLFKLKTYDHKRMMYKLKVSTIRLEPRANVEQYRFNLQKIYNWKCKDNDKADFINV